MKLWRTRSSRRTTLHEFHAQWFIIISTPCRSWPSRSQPFSSHIKSANWVSAQVSSFTTGTPPSWYAFCENEAFTSASASMHSHPITLTGLKDKGCIEILWHTSASGDFVRTVELQCTRCNWKPFAKKRSAHLSHLEGFWLGRDHNYCQVCIIDIQALWWLNASFLRYDRAHPCATYKADESLVLILIFHHVVLLQRIEVKSFSSWMLTHVVGVCCFLPSCLLPLCATMRGVTFRE